MNEFPETLTDALDRIPDAWEVWVKRHANNGGWSMSATRGMNGGELRIQTMPHPLWQQAFTELWGKL